jgi:hypothetical protein
LNTPLSIGPRHYFFKTINLVTYPAGRERKHIPCEQKQNKKIERKKNPSASFSIAIHAAICLSLPRYLHLQFTLLRRVRIRSIVSVAPSDRRRLTRKLLDF